MLATAVSGLVAAGGITWGLVANANTKAFCDSNTNNTAPITCTLTSTSTNTTIITPSAIQATVILSKGSPAQYVAITYQMSCSQGTATATTTQATAPALPVDQAISVGNPVTDTFVLGEPAPDSCTVNNVTATLYTDNAAKIFSTSGSFTMELTWTPATSPSSASPSPSPSPSTSSPPPTGSVPLIKGFGGKCLDDRGNSSANGTKVIIWTCHSSDKAQAWTFSAGELKHNGHCANDQGNGGSGSGVILWTCNGASNEKWFHSSATGEFILRSLRHGLLCLTDPGYSKTNGTQLIVFKCQNTSNQRWS